MKKSIPNEILLPEVARLIKEGHTVTITVRGNSMNPFLVDRRDRVTLGDFTTGRHRTGTRPDGTHRLSPHHPSERRHTHPARRRQPRPDRRNRHRTGNGRHDRSHAKRQTVHRRRQSLEALLLLVDEAKPRSPLAARPVQKNIKQNNHENQTRIYPAPDRR